MEVRRNAGLAAGFVPGSGSVVLRRSASVMIQSFVPLKGCTPMAADTLGKRALVFPAVAIVHFSPVAGDMPL